MFAIIVLACIASRAEGQDAQRPSVRFQPRISVQTAPPPVLYGTASRPTTAGQSVPAMRHHAAEAQARGADTQLICGMTVIRKTPDSDAKIILPPNRTGAAARKIEPTACTNRER